MNQKYDFIRCRLKVECTVYENFFYLWGLMTSLIGQCPAIRTYTGLDHSNRCSHCLMAFYLLYLCVSMNSHGCLKRITVIGLRAYHNPGSLFLPFHIHKESIPRWGHIYSKWVLGFQLTILGNTV